jgi:hypothetical protein
MKFVSGIALILVLSAIAVHRAEAIDVEEIKAILNRSPRICPANLSDLPMLRYKEHCGENYNETMSNMDAQKCQNETNGINDLISEYNTFVRKCTQIQNSPQKQSGTISPDVSERLKRAEEKAEQSKEMTKTVLERAEREVSQAYKAEEAVRKDREAQQKAQQQLNSATQNCANQEQRERASCPLDPTNPMHARVLEDPMQVRILENCWSKARANGTLCRAQLTGDPEQIRRAQQSVDITKEAEKQISREVQANRDENERRFFQQLQQQQAQPPPAPPTSSGNFTTPQRPNPAPTPRTTYTQPTPPPPPRAPYAAPCGYTACVTR